MVSKITAIDKIIYNNQYATIVIQIYYNTI